MREAWIIDGVRTPRARGKETGALHGIHPQQLLAQCLNGLADRVGLDPHLVDEVVVGNLSGAGDHGSCIGRLAVLAAGWPIEVPGFTVNRFCASGQQAIDIAAMSILSNTLDVVVAGGVESMSRWPPNQPLTTDGGNLELRARYPIVPQGISADLIATLYGFTREECDLLAVESQQRASRAVTEGRFAGVIPVVDAEGSVVLGTEENVRPSTSKEGLAALAPSFEALGTVPISPSLESFDAMCLRAYPQLQAIDHVHHAGNSSAIADGASAMLLCGSDVARAQGLRPRAKIIMSAGAGSDPVIMLTAPSAAARRCLKRAAMTVADVDLWEINEAFASVVLYATRTLDLDPKIVNPNGGSIALGHPIGATGGILIETALEELEQRDLSTALITMCTGAGMANATLIERV